MSIAIVNTQLIKSRNDNINNDYFNFLNDKISKNIPILKKIDKLDGELESIPNFNEYGILLKYNYSIKQLKQQEISNN